MNGSISTLSQYFVTRFSPLSHVEEPSPEATFAARQRTAGRTGGHPRRSLSSHPSGGTVVLESHVSSSALPVESPPPQLQPLAELPALVIAEPSRDVRGWEIRSQAGEVLGVVSDLLADPDRLVAEFRVVSPLKTGDVQVVVPVAAVAARPPYLLVGSGLQPIKLRYVSTIRLTVTATLAVLVVIILWLTRAWGC